MKKLQSIHQLKKHEIVTKLLTKINGGDKKATAKLEDGLE